MLVAVDSSEEKVHAAAFKKPYQTCGLNVASNVPLRTSN
jgi:hypothetical protein